MGKRNKKRKRWKNSNRHIVYLDFSSKACSDQINEIANKVFGSLYYTSSSKSNR
jgi:hypothetical protein